MKEKSYCCGCCSEDDDSNLSQASRKTSTVQTNKGFQDDVIQVQPLPISRQEIYPEKTQKLFYWEGFRSPGEEVHPQVINISVPTGIKQIAGTENEFLFLLEDGSLWSYNKTNGINLSLDAIIKPTQLGFAQAIKIEYIVCGKYHSLALDNLGNVYSWGSNRFGQLGNGFQKDCDTVKYPQLVKCIASKVVIQLAAGENHSVALTDNGNLYACGSNSVQQLGVTAAVTHSTIFIEITVLPGIPWGFIAAGGNQTFGLTVYNAVFVWGDQSKNQSGLQYNPNDEIPKSIQPAEATQFDEDDICFVATGKWHSVFIGNGESAKAYGSNRYNQVGPVFNEGIITQIAVGEYHTVMVGNGKLYCYGPELNDTENDLDKTNQTTPVPVTLPINKYNIFACGNATFVVPLSDEAIQNNVRCKMGGRRQILNLSDDEILPSFLRLRLEDDFVEAGLEERFRALMDIQIWNASFRNREDGIKHHPIPLWESYFGYHIDFVLAETFIQNLWSCKAHRLHTILVSFLDNLMMSMDRGSSHEHISPVFSYIPLIILNSPKVNIEGGDSGIIQNVFVRILRDLLVRNYSPVNEPEYLTKFATFLFQKDNLKDSFTTNVITLIYHGYSCDQLQRLVTAFKRIVVSTLTAYLEEGSNFNAALMAVHDCLKFLNSLATRNKKFKKISHHCFIIPQLHNLIDLTVEFTAWMQHKTFPISPQGAQRAVYLCDFPFILDGSAKAILLRCEQKLQMIGVSILSRIIEPPELQGFVLRVRRDNLLEDVLRQIFLFVPFDFKKPLRIQFVGEEGQDAGGVRKEFFLLLIRELLDFSADRGLLKLNEESHLAWFNEYNGSAEEVKFLMVFGVLAGLAIYNNTIIKLPFPSALYKKLLGERCEIEDLVELSPTEGNSLKQVLEYGEPDLEQVFSLTFEVSRDELGITKHKDLKPNGKNIPVTLGNKNEFIDLYVDNVFNQGVETSFATFKTGFDLVFSESFAIKLFRSDELMEIIIGNEDYDWGRLEVDCTYRGVFHKGHETIQFFWEVFHDLTLELKKQFLLFLTGSDRVPISGMSGIQICIQSIALNESYFPIAHTCYNLLDIPVYKSKETLKQKILVAIQHKEGFFIA